MLDMALKDIERVLYFEHYIVTEPGLTPLKHRVRVLVGAQRLPVEQPDQDEASQGEPSRRAAPSRKDTRLRGRSA